MSNSGQGDFTLSYDIETDSVSIIEKTRNIQFTLSYIDFRKFFDRASTIRKEKYGLKEIQP